MPEPRLIPIVELTTVRLKEFLREPEAVFWVFAFPVLMALALGVAFRTTKPADVNAGVLKEAAAQNADAIAKTLTDAGGIRVRVLSPPEAEIALRNGVVAVLVVPGTPPTYRYEVIFMNRDLDEVIASQNTMIARRGTAPGSDDRQMRQLYEQHLQGIKVWLTKQTNFRVLEVSYNEIVQHPVDEAQRVKAFLGLPMDVSKMSEAVDEQLYRNRGGLQSKL